MTAARFYSSTAGTMELQASITNTSTTITVDVTTGLPGTTPYTLVIDPGTTEEIVTVTGVSGVNLTVVRGQDGSPAQSHNAGATIRHMATARDFREPQEHMGLTAAHGVTGALVGTTDTQTLTHKNLADATNTFPASLATDAELAAHTGATAAHGATGAVVGTTNSQALTNKDLTSGTNTFPGSLATDAELAAHGTSTSGVHGVGTGFVVGTDLSQTLTNKTISGANNTFSNIPESAVTNLTSDLGALSSRVTVVEKVWHTTISITPSAPNTPTSQTVTFPAGRFSAGVGAVHVTPLTSVPGSTVTGWSVLNITATDCQVWVTRTNTTATGLIVSVFPA